MRLATAFFQHMLAAIKLSFFNRKNTGGRQIALFIFIRKIAICQIGFILLVKNNESETPANQIKGQTIKKRKLRNYHREKRKKKFVSLCKHTLGTVKKV